MSYYNISHHHLTNHLIYLSSSSSFWFSLWVDTAIQIAGSKCGGMFESAKRITNHIHLIVQAGCCVASHCAAILSSHRPLAAPSSCRLIAQADCCVTSHCATISSSCRAVLLSSHCAALLSSHLAVWLLRFYGTTFLRKGWRKICCTERRDKDRAFVPPMSLAAPAMMAVIVPRRPRR